MPSFSSLPNEIVLEICKHLDKKAVYQLALVSKHAHTAATQRLYHSIENSEPPSTPSGHLFSSNSDQHLLRTIDQSAPLAKLVRRFSIHRGPPNHHSTFETKQILNAVAGSLESLELSGFKRGQSIPHLPGNLRKLVTLFMDQYALNDDGSTKNQLIERYGGVRRLKALRHLSIMGLELFKARDLAGFLNRLPKLQSLRMGINGANNVLEPPLPEQLVVAFESVAGQIKDLVFVQEEDADDTVWMPGQTEDRQRDECVCTRVGRFSSMSVLERLGVPLDWIQCEGHTWFDPSISEDHQPLQALPTTLKILQLQLPLKQVVERVLAGLGSSEEMRTGDGIFPRTLGDFAEIRFALADMFLFVRRIFDNRLLLPSLQMIVVWFDAEKYMNMFLILVAATFWSYMPSKEEWTAQAYTLGTSTSV